MMDCLEREGGSCRLEVEVERTIERVDLGTELEKSTRVVAYSEHEWDGMGVIVLE